MTGGHPGAVCETRAQVVLRQLRVVGWDLLVRHPIGQQPENQADPGARTDMDVGHLLYELCTRLGYCLPADAQARLIANPPPDVGGFTDAVVRAKGINPSLVDRSAWSAVWSLVARHFADAVL